MSEPIGGSHTSGAGSSPVSMAIGPRGELHTAPVMPDLALASAMGWVYTATQAAAGVAPGTSATTTTPHMTLWYGASTTSFVYLVDFSSVYVSGTIGAGHIMFGIVASAAAPTGGTAITSYSTNSINSGTLVSAGTGHTTTAMSATTDRFPVMDLAATLKTAPAAGIGSPFNSPTRTPLNFWLPAGLAACFYGVTDTGSTPLIRSSVRYIIYPSTFLPT